VFIRNACLECASMSEYRDLLSEFNLLKDVRHKNVIRLLGICIHDGLLNCFTLCVIQTVTFLTLNRTYTQVTFQ